MIDPLLEKVACGRRSETRNAASLQKDHLVAVTELMKKLKANNYRCALTGLKFWADAAAHARGDYFTSPSVDRINWYGPCSNRNTRVILLGLNRWRGRRSDAELLRAIVMRARSPSDTELRRIARALVRRARRA